MLNFVKVRNLIFTLILVVVSVSGGYYLGVQGYKAEVSKALGVTISRVTPPEKNVDFSLFWNVWDTLSAKYYDKSKLVPAEMVYGAIEGMVAAVGDPYTMYLPPAQNKIVDEDLSGSFEGVGIEIGYRDSKLAVISPLPDSPAEKAGVKPGDYIVRIVDKSKNVDVNAQGISLPQAVSYIRGPANTKINLTLVRDGVSNPIEVEITRAKLDVPSVVLKFVGQNETVADIKVSKFGADTVDEWNKAVDEITKKSNVKNIIVDLRNNPGGYLQAAVDLGSDFVNSGTTIVIQENGDGTRQEYKSQKSGRLQNYNVIVLINGGSASASEILSGALRDNKNIKLVGEKSFGKGTVQEPVEIKGGSGLHVTTAKWLTPKGTWVHGNGLEPDVKILNDDKTVEDEQLQKAIELLN
ncbi:MAG TPA: S41 family peptidase [Alphaproteobacteria bacterium]|jgi:carboxyl-terminal processing protease|nr:S41 family peptidase [Alphaproteobacteria bacterium]